MASRLYRSKPIGPQDQPDFINAVACIQTHLTPLDLLDTLQSIEQQHGRIKQRHWGERCIDLDIILYDQTTMHHNRLILPHKEARSRSFVMFPLLEIAPELSFPDGASIREICSKLENDVEILDT